MTKQVIATGTGFYGGSRRRAGELFSVAKREKETWFKEVAAEPVKAKGDKQDASK